MTAEYVLILALYAFILLAVFLRHGPIQAFEKSGPHLGAKIEEEISVGENKADGSGCAFIWCAHGAPMFTWHNPQGAQ